MDSVQVILVVTRSAGIERLGTKLSWEETYGALVTIIIHDKKEALKTYLAMSIGREYITLIYLCDCCCVTHTHPTHTHTRTHSHTHTPSLPLLLRHSLTNLLTHSLSLYIHIYQSPLHSNSIPCAITQTKWKQQTCIFIFMTLYIYTHQSYVHIHTAHKHK